MVKEFSIGNFVVFFRDWGRASFKTWHIRIVRAPQGNQYAGIEMHLWRFELDFYVWVEA